MEFDRVIKERMATRKFDDRKLEPDKLRMILKAGQIAPTAKNLQPFKIYVVNSEDGLKIIDEASPCRYNAPTVLVICGDKDAAFMKKDHSTYEMDCCIVATHMMLKATDIGVDNIWVEMFDELVLKRNFDIPDNLVPVCILPMGYRAGDCPESINHNVRKNLDDIVIYK